MTSDATLAAIAAAIRTPGALAAYAVSDRWNHRKTHCWRVYRDGHITYNQAICGLLEYRRWARASRRHGYYAALRHHLSGRPIVQAARLQVHTAPDGSGHA